MRTIEARPNILLFFPDQLRYDWTGLNVDLPVRTPHVSRLAREGAAFTLAVSPSPLCAPCRAALMSGKGYNGCGVPSNRTDYPLDQPAFTQMLRDSGYHVMGCGKFDLHKATFDWGLDGRRLLDEWGFSDGIDNEGKWDGIANGGERPRGPYLQHLHERGLRRAHIDDFSRRRRKDATHPTPLPDDAYCDNWLAENGLSLLRRAPVGKPWFLQVNFTGPHDPWDITEGMAALYDGVSFPPAHGDESLPPERHVAVRRNYSAMVENIDRWVGTYLDELTRRGELDNTLVVFSSDHGEMLGDRGLWGKSVAFQPSIGVPLVVRGPSVSGSLVCRRPTTILDLTATFLEAAGLSVPGDMESRSLWPVLRGETDAVRSRVLSALGEWRAVLEGRHKLITGLNGGPQLYNLEADPREERNLAAQEPGLVSRLAAASEG